MLCLQVWQIMPKDKLEFLQAELSFFDEVTQVRLPCCPLCSQAVRQVAPSTADLLPCGPDRLLSKKFTDTAALKRGGWTQTTLSPDRVQPLHVMAPHLLVHTALLHQAVVLRTARPASLF